MKTKVFYLLILILASPGYVSGQEKTGTLKVFSEINGVTVYLDDSKVENYAEIKNVPVGTHYLKAIKDGVNVFGELITVKEGETTTILIKNSGQVEETVMAGKTKEIQEYNNMKLEVLITSRSITTTTGSNTLFPGYYGYWGYSNSVSSTQNISDFKIVQGGVKEIGDLTLANWTGNKAILDQNARDNLRSKKLGQAGTPLLLAGVVGTLVFLGDLMLDKPFLHKDPEHPDYEAYAFTGSVLSGIVGYILMDKSTKVYPRHYYRVEDAAREAQEYNRKLKERLGLPENYDIK